MTTPASVRRRPSVVRRLALWLALVCALAVSAPTSADAGSVAVFPARVSPALTPLADGFAHWVRGELERAGVDVATSGPRTTDGAKRPSDRALITTAREAGAEHALLLDLDFEPGEIEVLLRLHRTRGGGLIGAARNRDGTAALHTTAGRGLVAIMQHLGVPSERAAIGSTFAIGDLAELGRALMALESGQLAQAWRELETLPPALADPLRARIEMESASAERIMRLRLMNARGEAEAAWQEILREASEHLYAEVPDADILLAAGEIQLDRGKLDDAQAYFDRCLSVRATDLDAALGLARALGDQQDEAGADRAFAIAAGIAPESLRLKTALAESPSENVTKRALAALAAGHAVGRNFDRERANAYFARAIAFDAAIEPEALALRAELELALGEHTAALASYRAAISERADDPATQRGLARTLEALSDVEGAEAAYRAALALAPEDPEGRVVLARFLIATDRAEAARPDLEALVAEPSPPPSAMRALALLLRDAGELDSAMQLLDAAEAIAGPDSDALLLAASIERGMDRPAAAVTRLERALALDPTGTELRETLATVYQTLGRTKDAARQRQIARLLGANDPRLAPDVTPGSAEPGQAASHKDRGPLDGLVTAFGLPMAGERRAVLIDVSRQIRWGDRILGWLMPRSVQIDRVADAITQAIAVHYRLAQLGRPERGHASPESSAAIERLGRALRAGEPTEAVDFERHAADLASLDADVVFAARVGRGSILTASQCADASQLYVELVRLGGEAGATPQRHSACLPDGVAAYSSWSSSAAVLWVVLLVCVALPFLRGYGEVEVRVKLPADGRPRLTLALMRTGARTRTLPVEGSDPVRFTRVPARRSTYMVRLTGALDHVGSGQLLTEVRAERPVRIGRGDSIAIDFDLVGRASPVEVRVREGDYRVGGAQIALRGDPSSLRPTASGAAYLYLEAGRYTLLVGAHDRVLAFGVDVRGSRPVTLDLARASEVVFEGCTNAVVPYLEGNLSRAIDALEEAGQLDAAALMRARLHDSRGERNEARAARAQAGTLRAAAEMRSARAPDDTDTSLEREADFDAAAEAQRSAGKLAEAARAYEASGDYESAADCYRQLGDQRNALAALEKSNDYFQAACLALEIDDTDRALHNFGQVDAADPHYEEACLTIGRILAERGDAQYAIERFDAAHASGGLPGFPIPMLECYASLLESAGRLDDALAALLELRYRQPEHRDAGQRIAALESARERRAGGALGSDADEEADAPSESSGRSAARPAAEKETAAAVDSASQGDRYQVFAELGRGPLGEVVKATDRLGGGEVALRWLPGAISAHPLALETFVADTERATQLDHPNILKTIEAGQSGGRCFIASALLDGSDLDRIIARRGALPAKAVAQIGVQVASGLHYAHRRGILHLDLRAENLFLTREKTVAILGFGLGRSLDVLHRDGTPLRDGAEPRAPERERGEADARTDLYDLGVSLYALASGTPPMVDARGDDAPIPLDLRAAVPDAPEALARLIGDLTAPLPEDRPEHASDVVRALRSLLE